MHKFREKWPLTRPVIKLKDNTSTKAILLIQSTSVILEKTCDTN
jgi:hypothetical protein